jgi:hypothetical protein
MAQSAVSHEPARGIVDEHQQRASQPAVLKPAMLRAADLDKLAKALAAQAGLMKLAALHTRQPEPVLDHPLAQGLTRHLKPVALGQRLGSERRPEVGVALANQRQRELSRASPDAVVRRPATRFVPKR